MTILIKLKKKDIILRSLDLVCIVVPPALPGALTACLIYAQTRLKSFNIFCISPSAINVSGSITTFVFDKTGTLTEDDCSLRSVLPSVCSSSDEDRAARFAEHELTTTESLSVAAAAAAANNNNDNTHILMQALASCHSVTRINQRLDGDPVDLQLFGFSGWQLIEPGRPDESTNYDCMMPTIVRSPPSSSPAQPLDPAVAADAKGGKCEELGILRQFPFLSALQRMSVVVKSLDKANFDFYCKGSPEVVRSLCLKESIPSDFNYVLNKFSTFLKY